MNETVSVFTSFQPSDVWFLAQAAGRTLLISFVAIGIGTVLGCVFGWLLYEFKLWGAVTLGVVLDAFRSVPLIIRLILFFNFFPIIGFPLDPFVAGTLVLREGSAPAPASRYLLSLVTWLPPVGVTLGVG